MPELSDSYNFGRAAITASQNVPNVAVQLDSNLGKTGNRKRQAKSDTRSLEAKDNNETESLVLQMLQSGIIERSRFTGSYQISYGICKKAIHNIDNAIALKGETRTAIFDAVWSYYGRDRSPNVLETVSDATDIVESIIMDD